MKYYIPLINSELVAIVDKKGYELCKKYKWKINKKGYATCPGIGRMHRLITSCPKGMEVHHKNHNKLDNRRSNLQNVTPEQHKEIHRKKP